jgi:hypothetical protein
MANIYDLAEALANARIAGLGPHVEHEWYARIFEHFERNPNDFGIDLSQEPGDVDSDVAAFTRKWARPEAPSSEGWWRAEDELRQQHAA